MSVRTTESQEGVLVVEVLWVASPPVPLLALRVRATLIICVLTQQHHVGAVSARLTLPVIVVRVRVGASPPGGNRDTALLTYQHNTGPL